MNEQRPNSEIAHDPIDMGDQYFSNGADVIVFHPVIESGHPWSSAALTTSDFSIMCQNRPGWFKSRIKKTAQSRMSGKAIA